MNKSLMVSQPDKIKHTIVLVGKFNPAIFHPAWFYNQELISKSDFEDAKVDLVHPDLSQVTLLGMTLVVTSDRFQLVSTEAPYFPFMKDLAIGTFSQLSHSIVTALGINSEARYTLDSIEQWHSFGHRLAPKDDIWDKILDNPGMIQISVQGQRENGTRNVTVQPVAQKVILIKINDHFKVMDDETPSAARAMETLDQEWENSQQSANRIFEHLISEAQK